MNKREYYEKQLPKKEPGEFWSDEQRLALYTSGENIIVSAGAGSGKTAVLTERIVKKLIKGTKLKNLIVLTFTNNAATEMRIRIKESLKNKINQYPNLKEELDYLELAHIQTFDAFALSMVKEYHYLLDLPKDIRVTDETYLLMIQNRLIESIFDEFYDDKAFCLFLEKFTIKDDDQIKKVIISFYNKIRTFPNPNDYIDGYLKEYFCDDFYSYIKENILNVFKSKYQNMLDIIECIKRIDSTVCLDYGKKVEQELNHMAPGKTFADFLNIKNVEIPRIPTTKKDIDEIQKEELKTYKSGLSDEFKALKSLIRDNIDIYINDYLKTKDDISVVLKIIKELNIRFNQYLRENNIYSFMDIARFLIKMFEDNHDLLCLVKNNTEEILIDEYQDTSTIQEKLIQMISNNNLYMVGDIKQSIYRFRYANPDNFQKKYLDYSVDKGGFAIDLMKNFRSRKEVLDNINLIFEDVMSKDYGGVDYKINHALSFGFEKFNDHISGDYNMEILAYDAKTVPDQEEAEAIIIAEDIKNRVENKQLIYDKSLKKLRECKYSDFVILTKTKTCYDTYKKVFEKESIPLYANITSELISADEIFFLINTLKLAYSFIDDAFKKANYNKSLIGFLRGFVIGESDEIISKLVLNNYNFKELYPELFDKVYKIATAISLNTLSDVILMIFDEFDIYNRLPLVGDISNRMKKLNFFVSKAIDFETLDITIPDFIDYLEYLRKNKIDLDYEEENNTVNAVSITTIHKSKGLEYPICYFPYLYKRLNTDEINGSFLLSDKWGMVIPFFDEGLNESILKDLIKEDFYKETISEQIRLLYVALTRAKEKFIVIIPKPKCENETPINVTKSNYRSLADIFYSIYYKLTDYRKDYTPEEIHKKIENFNSIIASTKDLVVENIKLDIIDVKFSLDNQPFIKASAVLNGLLTKEDIKKLNYGTKLHSYFEQIKIKDYQNRQIDQSIKKILDKFYLSDFISNLNIINEYHELAYSYNGVNGIIDLLLETDDKIIIIDYKTKNTLKDDYKVQVKLYKDYVVTKTNKIVECFLYSIIDGQFSKVK